MKELIDHARKQYLSYLEQSESEPGYFHFTLRIQESSLFTLCFGIFGHRLLRNNKKLLESKDLYLELLKRQLFQYWEERKKIQPNLLMDKPFLQALCFSFTAIDILDGWESTDLSEIVAPLVPTDVCSLLDEKGASRGGHGSGNFAMFYAILLMFAEKHLGQSTQSELERWIDYHLRSMNRFGFWGDENSNPYILFQNGYHQYEIFKYLKTPLPQLSETKKFVSELSDFEGRFAPWPGGGGCFDFDAIFLLLLEGSFTEPSLLLRSQRSILEDQNPDGGFSESCTARPQNAGQVLRFVRHLGLPHSKAGYWRYRKSFAQVQPKNQHIAAHWVESPRKWSESDLWDSWFRMQAVALIDCHLKPQSSNDWGFSNFPGIGYHPSQK